MERPIRDIGDGGPGRNRVTPSGVLTPRPAPMTRVPAGGSGGRSGGRP